MEHYIGPIASAVVTLGGIIYTRVTGNASRHAKRIEDLEASDRAKDTRIALIEQHDKEQDRRIERHKQEGERECDNLSQRISKIKDWLK